MEYPTSGCAVRTWRPIMARCHTVLSPDAITPHAPASDDVALLLADLVRAVRLGEPVTLLQPLVAACSTCAAAFTAARRVVTAAGGVNQWLKHYEQRTFARTTERDGDMDRPARAKRP
jgi:hypothetical protein